MFSGQLLQCDLDINQTVALQPNGTTESTSNQLHHEVYDNNLNPLDNNGYSYQGRTLNPPSTDNVNNRKALKPHQKNIFTSSSIQLQVNPVTAGKWKFINKNM